MAIIEITGENFDETVLQSSKPVMIDFWATWCGPCRMQAPVFDKVAEKTQDAAVFGKIDVDKEMELAQQFDVMSIPTILVIKGGSVVFRATGVQSEKQLTEALQAQ